MSDIKLTAAQIAGLLDLLAEGQEPAVRVATCKALSHLPLDDSAAEAAEHAVEAVLDNLSDGSREHKAILDALQGPEVPRPLPLYDPDGRITAAIEAARAGDPAPLEALVDEVDGDDPPEVFWGSPWTAYDTLAVYGPLPIGVTDRLLARLEAEDLGRNAQLLIRALTGVADAEGNPPGEPEPIRQASPEEASSAADALVAQPLQVQSFEFEQLHALEALDAARAAHVANWVLTEARRLGVDQGAHDAYSDQAMQVIAHLPSEGLSMGAIYEVARRGPRQILANFQLGWIAARLGPERVVAGLGPLIEAAVSSAARLELLDLIASSGIPAASRPPMLQPMAGPDSVAVTPPSIEGRWARVRDRLRGGRGQPASLPAEAPHIIRSGVAIVAELPEPSRTAWPHLLCDEEVVVETPFALEVGLRGDQLAGVGGTGAMVLPARAFDLDVEISIDGFAIEAGTARFTLRVDEQEPYPVATLLLTATRDPSLKANRTIGVSFFVDDTLRGYADRLVRVVESAQQLGQSAPPVAAPASGINNEERAVEGDPDVTIVITTGDDVAGTKLLWTARSTMAGVEAPPPNLDSDLGRAPEAFARQIIDSASTAKNPVWLFDFLKGNGEKIAQKIPAEIRQMLARAVTDAGERSPSVLIYSAEPHIPWELAAIDELPGHGQLDVSPFLGARVALGRWPHDEPPPPRDPLTDRVTVAERAIVRGVYEKVPGWPKLEAAEAEAAGFHTAWRGSTLVDATFSEVRRLIRGTPPADLLHFAMHGQLSDRATQNGLVLVDREAGPPEKLVPMFLEPSVIRSADDGLKRRPFVFLNACQVGAGQKVLGDHGGMAVAFLAIGAAAIVAPIWSVIDTVASKAAAGFYTATLPSSGAAPVPVAEALRVARARFTDATVETADALEASTYLAYTFFGHPRLILTAKGT